MKKRAYCIIAIIPLLVILLHFSAWAVPNLINYQGKLTDSDGTALNGDYTIIFYIYNDETNGTALWGPENKTVSVTNGIFDVQLGGVPFPSNLFDNDVLYLEIQIYNADADSEEILEPRQRLTSTAFAMKAGDADTVDGVQAADLEESSEIDSKIADHASIADAHHTKTTSFTEFKDSATDAQIPDNITINYAASSGNADTIDGKHASYFLDTSESTQTKSGSLNISGTVGIGTVGIGTTTPISKLTVQDTTTAEYGLRVDKTVTGGNSKAMNSKAISGLNTVVPAAGYMSCGGFFKAMSDAGSEAGRPTNKCGVRGQATGTGGVNYGGRFSASGAQKNYGIYVESGSVYLGSGNVGIGTTNPTRKLHIHAGNVANYIRLSNTNTGQEEQDGFYLGMNSTGRVYLINKEETSMRFQTAGLTRMVITGDGNVGIGTTTPNNKLDVKGTIRAEELIVETGWADFVFKDDYELMSLNKIEDYIAQNGHLPDIPTAKDVEENGIGVGQMQTKLLQKIEELTLHLIKQNKRIADLEKRISNQNQ